jgi:hypothetical protein
MSIRHRTFALASALAVLAGCSDNPTAVDDHEEILTAELTFSAEELSTLTTLEVEVSIHNDHGATVTDFVTVAVEFRMAGDTDWRATELSLHENHFSGEKMFYTSGDYEARVVAQRVGHAEAETLYQTTENLQVKRIHQEVGGYIVEFETTPGHIHEGDEAEVQFWILEASPDGHGHAMEGLTVEIHCTDANGAEEHHDGHAHAGGLYETRAVFAIHFADDHGEKHEAEFHVPISHAH